MQIEWVVLLAYTLSFLECQIPHQIPENPLQLQHLLQTRILILSSLNQVLQTQASPMKVSHQENQDFT